jgi:hypothetical protein
LRSRQYLTNEIESLPTITRPGSGSVAESITTANRLFARSRPEFEDYRRWGAFDPDHPPDPLAILAVTECMRQTDEFEVFSFHPENSMVAT